VDTGRNPFDRWTDLHRSLGILLRQQESDPQFIQRLIALGAELEALVERDADAAIFAMTRLDLGNYAIAHSLQTAIVCDIIARRMSSDPEQRSAVVNAALTMNLSMLELQHHLSQQLEPLSPAQQEQIKAHPQRSHDRLVALGVKDQAWLTAVLQHHESADGKGYPGGVTEIAVPAEIIHLVDMYCAMLSPRSGRQALPPNRVARDIYVITSGNTQRLAALLIKELGLYPPGTFVRLASGETAVVTQRGEQANSPKVGVVMSVRGVKLPDPIRRNTVGPEYAIVSSVQAEDVLVQLNPAKLFSFAS